MCNKYFVREMLLMGIIQCVDADVYINIVL